MIFLRKMANHVKPQIAVGGLYSPYVVPIKTIITITPPSHETDIQNPAIQHFPVIPEHGIGYCQRGQSA